MQLSNLNNRRSGLTSWSTARGGPSFHDFHKPNRVSYTLSTYFFCKIPFGPTTTGRYLVSLFYLFSFIRLVVFKVSAFPNTIHSPPQHIAIMFTTHLGTAVTKLLEMYPYKSFIPLGFL